eukprot:sb/3477260/
MVHSAVFVTILFISPPPHLPCTSLFRWCINSLVLSPLASLSPFYSPPSTMHITLSLVRLLSRYIAIRFTFACLQHQNGLFSSPKEAIQKTMFPACSSPIISLCQYFLLF